MRATESLGRFGHHPDPIIDGEVELDRKDGQLAECHAILHGLIGLDLVAPRGVSLKSSARRVLREQGAW